MLQQIKESDWKIIRELRQIALDRFCQRVLSEVVHVATETTKSNHERYLDIYDLLQRRDKELGKAFDNPRRSVAYLQIVCIQSHNLWTKDELARFGPEAQEVLRILLGDD